jgi:hypothetical protein
MAAPAEGAPAAEKPKRGKPKDEHAPKKPKNPFGAFASECRPKLKESRPELITDLRAMGTAIAEEWAKVSDAEKARLQATYEKEMEVWRPLWEKYKQTSNYKEFVEVKTDWLDKRAQKKLVKTMNSDAPKRAKSGYMIYAGEIRESVMEKVKAEGLGLGDAGRIISERWAEISEAKKAEYGEKSQQMKIAFDKDFAVYKKTTQFGEYCDAKAKLEASQKQKKLVRTRLDEAPKRPPSAYALFRNEVMPDITKENQNKKEGEGKLSMGEMGKKVAEMWSKVPEDKKAAYQKEADKAKALYDIAYKKFKAGGKYISYIEDKQKVKARENLLVNLREMPKRPKSVFAMFAKDHKDEVPAGKGEGKGSSALRQVFAKASQEEKAKYEAENKKLTEAWQVEVKEWKSGVKYQTYESTKKKIMEEFKNEAIKVTTLKFLDSAPAPPPKSGFAIFVSEKRKAAGPPAGEKKSKEAKKADVAEFQKEWQKMEAGLKSEFDNKRKDVMIAYEAEIKAFMEGPTWQEYQKEAKRLRIPIRSLLLHKKKVIARLGKDGKPNPNAVQLPDKPETFPSKPRNALSIFTKEKKKTVKDVSQIGELWAKLSAEDKAEWDNKAAEEVKQYKEAMQEFTKSDEGKKYLREVAAVTRRRKFINAKNKYLDDLPQKPAAAVMTFMKNNAKKVKKDHPDLKTHELRAKLDEMWKALPEAEKEPLTKAANEKMRNSQGRWRNLRQVTNGRCIAQPLRRGWQ